MAIDIGSTASDRGSTKDALLTIVVKANTANGSGVITSVEIWANTNLGGCVVGTFYSTGASKFKCRDSEAIGDVTAGSKQTFPVTIDVRSGDYIGMYYTSGTMEYDTSGGGGIYWDEGEFIDPGDERTYSFYTGNHDMSLYGTGVTTSTSTTTTSTSTSTTTSTSTSTSTTTTSTSTSTSTTTSTSTSTTTSTSTSTSTSTTTTTSTSTSTSTTTTSISTSSSTTTSTSTSTSTTTTTSTSTSTSTSTTTTVGPEGIAWGASHPLIGEARKVWAGWTDGAAGSPTFQYGSSWGRIKLETTEIGHSDVIDTGNTKSKTITISIDRYGTGVGIGVIYIRGQATTFAQDAASPSWEEYTAPVAKTWRWIQVKLAGPVD